jgi:hypothetical protein
MALEIAARRIGGCTREDARTDLEALRFLLETYETCTRA